MTDMSANEDSKEAWLDSALRLTFWSNFRNDFPRALAEVIRTEVFTPGTVSWVKIEVLRGRISDHEDQKSIRYIGYEYGVRGGEYKPSVLNLNILGNDLQYEIAWQSSNEDISEAKTRLDDFFHNFLNGKFKNDSNLIALAFDWYWSLIFPSTGVLEKLKKGLLKYKEKDRKKLENAIQSYFEGGKPKEDKADDILRDLLWVLWEIINKYREAFPAIKDSHSVNRMAKDFLKKRFWFHYEILHYGQQREKDAKNNDSLRSLWNQDRLFLEIREELFGFFNFYINTLDRKTPLCKPFFFIYDPFIRCFQYRGLLPEKDGIRIKELKYDLIKKDYDKLIDEIDSLKDYQLGIYQFRHTINKLKDEEKTEDVEKIRFIESLPQSFDIGFTEKLYLGRNCVFSKDVSKDILKTKLRSSPCWKLLKKIEENVLGLYGELPMFFLPLLCDGQYRGFLWFSFAESEGELLKESIQKVLKSAPLIDHLVAQKIEDFQFNQFQRNVQDYIMSPHEGAEMTRKGFLDKITKTLPYLLNTELSGHFPLYKDEKNRVRCLNARVNQRNRFCNLFGFKYHPGFYQCVITDDLKLCTKGDEDEDKRGRCYWEQIFEQIENILDVESAVREYGSQSLETSQLRPEGERFSYLGPIIVEIGFDEVKSKLKEQYTDSYKLDLRQKYPSIDNKNGNKLYVIWLIERPNGNGRTYDCIWSALDIPPWVFNEKKDSFKNKLKSVIDLFEDFREYGQIRTLIKWKEMSQDVAHEFGHVVAELEGAFNSAVEKYLWLKPDVDIHDKFNIPLVESGIKYGKIIIAAFGSRRLSNSLVKKKENIVNAIKKILEVSIGSALFSTREERHRKKITVDDYYTILRLCWDGPSILEIEEDLKSLCLFFDDSSSKTQLQTLRGEAILAILFQNIFDHFFSYYDEKADNAISKITIDELIREWNLRIMIFRSAEDRSRIEISVTNKGKRIQKKEKEKKEGTKTVLISCLEATEIWGKNETGKLLFSDWDLDRPDIFKAQLILPKKMFVGNN